MCMGHHKTPANRWYDKVHTEVWSKNGCFSTSNCHASVDGLVMVLYLEYMANFLVKSKGVWQGKDDGKGIKKMFHSYRAWCLLKVFFI